MPEKKAVVLSPKGYVFNLIMFIFVFCCWLILFSSLIYDILLGNNQIYDRNAYLGFIVSFIMPIAILGTYGKIGEYVILSEEGISKPMKIKHSSAKFISPENIQWYMKIYSVYDPEKIVGVTIMTKDNKKIKYSDRKTPNSSRKILDYLEEKKAQEKIPEKKHWG